MEHSDDAGAISLLRQARNDRNWSLKEVAYRIRELVESRWPKKPFGVNENMVYRHEANINKPGKEYRWAYTQLYGKSEKELDILPRSRIRTFPSRLTSLALSELLKDRSQLPTLREFAQAASEIYVVATSAGTILPSNLGFFEQKMREGCKLRFVLLDPDPTNQALQVFNRLTKVELTASNINTSVSYLNLLESMQNVPGTCQHKFTRTLLSCSACIVNPSEDNGAMIVEFFAYKKARGERPHIQLTRQNDRYWFESFIDQFEHHWNDANNN